MRISKEDVAADPPVLVRIQDAIDAACLAVNQVKEIRGTTRNLKVDDISLVHIELAEGVIGIGATDRGGGDVGDIVPD